MKLFQTLVLGSLVLGLSPALAASLDPQAAQIFTEFYPASQLALVSRPGYQLTNAQLFWGKKDQQPTFYVTYHRAVPMYDHGVTLHFSLVLRHEPRSQVVKPGYTCQKDYLQSEFNHPQFGPYVLCAKQLTTKPHATHSNAGLLYHVTARALPKAGNRLPHLSLSLHGFKEDILPLLNSLHTYSQE